ncbi:MULTISPECIES: ribonuclease R [unclassified Mycoplasma]|uniref:ribonuclease R n=1 Tax=unclassified Mycoplasma TaxID=2683645 RepID=UPI00216AEC39|nr:MULTISPECIES: ribonuclease R [unclassified Mycoplasma]MCS4536695.1 ribonuclease R [Mycoplasma sp. CSL7475-4]MCT4469818.1 ribonuclease R [Mycoplasma sp. HS2188]
MIEEKNIFNFVKSNPKSNFVNIAKGLKIPFDKNKQLTQTLMKMSKNNQLLYTRDKNYVAIEYLDTIEGKLKYAKDGRFGFIDIEIEGEERVSYFVSSVNFNGALSGDQVKAKVYKQLDSQEEKEYAVVVQIKQRNSTTLNGVIELKNNILSFRPLKNDFKSFDFVIKEFKVDSRIDDLVVAKITDYNKKTLTIDIVEKISNISDPLCYVKSLLAEMQLPKGFEKEVLDEAATIPDTIDAKGMKNRVDFRDELVITIDGESTKDYDDAISIKKIDNKYYQLGVHIADVSYYVRENSEIDKEALKRGTSTYLANQVIPMLPEKLSNGICSLNPNEDRFTMSILIDIDNNGKTIKSNIVQGIINSKYRLTYKRVNDFIDNKVKFTDNSLNKMLNILYELTQKIRKVKNEEGYIDLEIEEPKIILDENNKVVDVVVDRSGTSEKMIEDFMVRANEEVAKTLAKNKIPLLYRVHETPSEEKINQFKQVMNSLNIKVEVDSLNLTPKSFQNTIEKIKKQRFDSFLQTMFLRTMSKAVYSVENIGHFGLASEFYCHFTSPIRRYPDLIVHRVIRDILINKDRTKIEHMNKILPAIAELNSESEQKAMQVERDTNDLLYAEYFADKIGQSYNVQIVSILKFGMFVEFENKTNALVHLSTMTDDEYVLNTEGTELVGTKTKNKYRLGDKTSVVILSTDPINGKVDACLVKNYQDYYKALKGKINKTNS